MLQHVLRALPVYNFLGLGPKNVSYKKLESPCRSFLWGTSADGRNKTTLVKWDSVTKLRRNGGLQLKTFQKVSELLKMRYLGRLLNSEKSDWAQMLRFFIKQQIQRRSNGRELKFWTAEEGVQSLEESPSWRWQGAESKWNGWLQPSNFWHRLLESQETLDDLSAKWPEGPYEFTWEKRWKALWGKGGLMRTKLWTWRLIRQAFFMGERAEVMRIAPGICCRCKTTVESTPHLFLECRHSQAQWRQLKVLANRARASFQIPHGLLQTIDEALRTKAKGGTLLYILHSITNTIWKDRNVAVFQNRLQATPLLSSLKQARIEIEGSVNNKSSDVRWQQGLRMLEEINSLIEHASSATAWPAAERVREEGTNSPSRVLAVDMRSSDCPTLAAANNNEEEMDSQRRMPTDDLCSLDTPTSEAQND
ncbi:hypothetical protein R1flu_028130 [Riccia fluitans]|uniref:Reverse transcriptase zinc-binding domain-containing protein n=1 Tax=Riccia fluitans TaxID=41844 RepID=A0ABD1XKT0_9MARC